MPFYNTSDSVPNNVTEILWSTVIFTMRSKYEDVVGYYSNHISSVIIHVGNQYFLKNKKANFICSHTLKIAVYYTLHL